MMCAYPDCEEQAKVVCRGCSERFCARHKNPAPSLSLGIDHASDAHWIDAIASHYEHDMSDIDLGGINGEE